MQVFDRSKEMFQLYTCIVKDYILRKVTMVMGVARIFQRGGHTGSNNIVMAFLPRYIVGYLLKKRLTKGGSRAPQDPPCYAHDGTGACIVHWHPPLMGYLTISIP